MQAAMTITPTISKPLTWKEICQRYPDEWVCLVEIDRIEPQNFEFRTARVVSHGKTRREPLDQARPWREHYKTIGHYFTERGDTNAERAALEFVRIDIPMGMPLFLPLHGVEVSIDVSGDSFTVELDGEP